MNQNVDIIITYLWQEKIYVELAQEFDELKL